MKNKNLSTTLKFNKPTVKPKERRFISSQSIDNQSSESKDFKIQTQTETESENECVTFDLSQYVKNNQEKCKKEFEEMLEEAKLKKLEKDRTLIPSSLQMVLKKYMEKNIYVNYVDVKVLKSKNEFIRHLLSINFELDVPKKNRLQNLKPEFKSEVDRELIKSVKILLYSSDNEFKKTKLEKKYFNNNIRKITKNKIPKNLPSGLKEILNYMDYSHLAEGLFHMTKAFVQNLNILNLEMVHDNFFLYLKISDVTYIKKPLQEMKEQEIKELVRFFFLIIFR